MTQYNKSKKNLTKKNSKAQISFEFLMTYGWAFLVALIVVGALAYFGIFSPDKYTSKRCLLAQGLQCNDYALLVSGNTAPTSIPSINLKITNMLGKRISVIGMDATTREGTPLSGCTATSGGTPVTSGISIAPGTASDFIITCAAGTGDFFNSVGDKKKVELAVQYYDIKSGMEYNSTLQGEIYDQVRQI